MGDEKPKIELPRENLCRAVMPGGFELRAVGDAELPTMAGHFAIFNEWTTIDSYFEGTFLERIAPGAFTKTFAENRDRIRVLLEHGRDPQVGNKPLGPVEELREDDRGAYYEVPLLDTTYNRDLVPALESGQYGSSFRFRVMKEEFVDSPEPSAANPKGLPERTIKEAQVFEFGPCTFPAYDSATAGVRSLTDEYLLSRVLGGDQSRLQQLRRMLEDIQEPAAKATPPQAKPVEATSRRTADPLTAKEFIACISRT